MSCPTTHAKNAHQHPGQILVEGKQKRRTPEQKQANDTRAKQERLEQEAARDHGIKRIANIINESRQEEASRLTNPPKPRPQPRALVKGPAVPSSVASESQGDDDEVDGSNSEMVGKDSMDIETTSELLASSQEGRNVEIEGQEREDNETLSQAVSKRSRSQKASTREAVLAATRGSSRDEIADEGMTASAEKRSW